MHKKVWLKVFLIIHLNLISVQNYVHGKQNHLSFPTGDIREKGMLEVVSYAFRPMSFPSLGGYRYYVSFIDDLSEMTWLYLLMKKLDVFEKFLEIKALAENQTIMQQKNQEHKNFIISTPCLRKEKKSDK